jgi:pimeloyl-ACP methyl ester carboxylesterase
MSVFLIGALLLVVGLILISLMVEALRPAVTVPDRLTWANDIQIQYVTVNGHRLRYVKTGNGPSLVLLHTLRTQLDIFQKIIPSLSRHFTVYAPDYPGHGYSDIPSVDYEPKLFVNAVAGFLETLDIQDATVAGISIGGTIALLLAAQHHPRVKTVIAINPYDYAKGLGIRRSSVVAQVLFRVALVPILGETAMRFRNRTVEAPIFNGGVAEPSAIPAQLREEMFLVGTRPGHYQAFLSLLRHAHKWEDAHARYNSIQGPTLVVYGQKDWSTITEREATQRDIPGATVQEVAGGGHFLSLDRPQEIEGVITGSNASSIGHC